MRSLRFWCVNALLILVFCSMFGTGAAASWRQQNLTREEILFLESHPVLRAGVGTAFPPIMYVQREGEAHSFKGMVADYLTLLEERLEITIEPVLGIPFSEALRLGRLKRIDIFPCVAETVERGQFLDFTQPYLSYPLVIIARDNSRFISSISDLVPLRIAIARPLSVYSRLVGGYPEIQFNFVFKSTVPDVLKAVAVGEADACIINLAVAIHEINKQGLDNLRVVAPTPWENNELSVAVRDDWPILLGIFEKALTSVSIYEHQTISSRWIDGEIPTPFDYYGVLKWGGGLVAVCLLISLVAVLWIRSLKQEIARRKGVEVQLKEAEASLIHAAQVNDLVLWDWDIRNDILEFTSTSADSSVSPKKLIGFMQRWRRDIHPEDERFAAEQLDAFLTGEAGEFEVEYRKLGADGLVSWEHMAGVVLSRTSGERPGRMIGFFRDITANKEMVKKKARSDKLESIGRLALGMAHEMNTPLHYIKGNMRFVDEAIQPFVNTPSRDELPVDDTAPYDLSGQAMLRESVKAIAESVEGVDRVARIINALKLFAHVNESGMRDYPLVELVEKALTVTENEWKYCASVNSDVADDLMVFCNPGDVIQLVTLLVVNASHAVCRRFEERSKGVIEVQAYSEEKQLVLIIRDNGSGVDEYSRSRLFDPLFVSEDIGEVAGKGLYVANNIVKKYNGTIACHNNETGGASFTMKMAILSES